MAPVGVLVASVKVAMIRVASVYRAAVGPASVTVAMIRVASVYIAAVGPASVTAAMTIVARFGVVAKAALVAVAYSANGNVQNDDGRSNDSC